MPVNSVHPDYKGHQDQWRTARDVVAGEREVKRAGIRYVPRLEGMNDLEYRAYVERGFFYNATARTVAGYVGMIFRREPLLKVPSDAAPLAKVLGEFRNDCDLVGKELGVYARGVIAEVLVVGRAGTLIDWAEGEERAYWSLYRTEDILNWREERIDGRMELTLVVLREMRDAPADAGKAGDGTDEFVARQQEQIRVLRLATGSFQGMTTRFYQVEIWGKGVGTDGKLVLLEKRIPQRRGQPLPNIPFVFHGPIVAKVISANEVLVATKPGVAGRQLACAETLAGANNVWAATALYGGADAFKGEQLQGRVANASEVALGSMRFVFPFVPVAAVVQVG